MTDRRDARPQFLGDPPTSVLASDDLSVDAVAAMLTAPSAAGLLEKLGISGQDQEDLAPLLPQAASDPEILAEVTRTANLLRAGAGLEVPTVELESLTSQHAALAQRLAPGEGLIAILALVVSTSTVRAWHEARGLSVEQSWEVLADLGQQMRVHRLSSGRLGLHQLGWMALNWCGRLVHLGRLQFDLHRTGTGTGQERWVVGTHIPARGPLTPTAVEDSFVRATEYFTTHFADLDADRPEGAARFGHEFLCDSWLMNPVLVQELGAGSNIGAFVDRWEILSTTPGADGAAFFVFHRRPPYDAAALPRTTRLERTVAERLADGRGWENGLGRLVR
ncbi:acyltransferase domain-containing protein [Brachybacterium sp. FME24]|uniref:acyltransferase domain-containing protein n=1 Tax=Brachybacterium sp. FME24 TaxID=2742605 RepID=UPI001868270F|nr:acyltransferase domain-containing protein [Brachybacterium sp. FME24]